MKVFRICLYFGLAVWLFGAPSMAADDGVPKHVGPVLEEFAIERHGDFPIVPSRFAA